MKNLNILISSAVFSLLTACGSSHETTAETSANLAATNSVIHYIQPLGVSSSCFGSFERIIRDHRYTPTRVYSEYLLGMKSCSPPASSLVIQMLGGQQWVGGYSYVTIKKNGLCLTNPVANSTTGVDKGETFYKPCIAQNSSAPDHYRQQWVLVFNSHNALQIQTRAAQAMGFQNSQVQCLDRQDPTTVKRVACSLHNWQVVRAN